MAYSNGYNVTQVLAAMTGRLAWRNPIESPYNIVDSANSTSKSGRYFDGFHALVNAKNVKDTAPYAVLTAEQFNTHLGNMQNDAIMRALNGVFNEHECLEQSLLFEREGRSDFAITNEGKFVGYEIEIPDNGNISVQIDSTTLLFDSNATFNIYLFKDGKKTAVKTQSVTVVANEATVVDLTDWIINFIDNGSTKLKGCKYFLGYFQDDLGSAKAINETADWEETKCFEAEPFQAAKISGQTDFDRVGWSNTNLTYGINLEVSAFKDLTNVIVKKASLLDELVGLQMAYMVLEQIQFCVRSNGNERMLKDQVLQFAINLELTGVAPISDSPQILGLGSRIKKEAERVRSSLMKKPKALTVNLAEEC